LSFNWNLLLIDSNIILFNCQRYALIDYY
jgi:hypothetical protein